ncbi:hypothetical protein Patl1_15186 [Pistacia atlantica]|uniref:Uncharacterized protein n=1 Tax=Pistacia atlantica TaxID=434234 RepID=A0ACC1B5E9_9ROSI|nr:hypothetical protein Patl1_15186 [Pistacia atlantica]
MREESLCFLSFLMSLLMFLFISEIQARKLQQCSSSCGEINIEYPFRLEGDPANCGNSDFELSCESNKTILEFDSEKYYVKEFFHRENKTNVVNINLANGSCSLPYKSPVPEDNAPQFNYWIPDSYSSVSFLRCYRNISDPACRRVPCLSGNNSYVYITYSADVVSSIPVSCSVISVVTSKINFTSTFRNNEIPSYETFREILQMGYNLTWSVEGVKDSGECELTLISRLPRTFICNNKNEGFVKYILPLWEHISLALRPFHPGIISCEDFLISLPEHNA